MLLFNKLHNRDFKYLDDINPKQPLIFENVFYVYEPNYFGRYLRMPFNLLL